ncbi:MAG: helix-turn-helix domain-containing protein [Candidatus Woesearchaeota archaeon]|jgi:sugar-specific transcriptional regulator TrmB
MDIKTLISIGLTKGEANVYLTLLKIGSTTSGRIINESRVSRSKVYDVLGRLKQKGLATEVIKENVKYFESTDPKKIIEYLQIKKQDIQEKIEQSNQIVEDLNKLKSLHVEKQEARVYTEIEGLKTIYSEILEDLEAGEEYLAFGIGKTEIQTKEVSSFFKNFHLKRADKKVNARIIMQPETKKEMANFSQLKYYHYKFTEVKIPTNIAIWKDNVLHSVWEDKPLAFVIKSKQIADKYREYFNDVWKSAKK